MKNLMNSCRKSANAYGDVGKASFSRNKRGFALWDARTREYEKLNKKQPVKVYRLEEVT